MTAELEGLAEEVAAAGIDVDADLSPLLVPGDHAMLQALVRNLLVNAVRHNLVRGGGVRVTTGLDSRGRPLLEVGSSGDTLEPELVSTLAEPFVRARGRTRSPAGPAGPAGAAGPAGSGLGLTIVASVARAHGADLSLRARPGGGLVATVTFDGLERSRAVGSA